jgi:outer membrane receptor for Fe3+-dicitrate
VPWAYLLDAQVVYTPEWAEGVSMRLAVNNIFDSKDYYRVQDDFEEASRAPQSDYGHPRGYVAPRSMTFQVGYSF